MKVTSRLLPTNSNLAMHQEATMPNTVFSGTAIAGDHQRERIAERTSGSSNELK